MAWYKFLNRDLVFFSLDKVALLQIFFMKIQLKSLLLLIVCAAALMLAGAADAGNVWVSSENDNNVIVFSVEGQQEAVIPTCRRPRHLAFSPNYTRLYVACGNSDAIGIIDVAQREMVGEVPVGESPEIFALSNDGLIAYASIEDESALIAYNLDSKKPLFRVATGGEPEGVLLSQDGSTAYVTSEVSNAVHVIDVTSRKQVSYIPVGKRPRRGVLTPDGKSLWVTNELGASISVIHLATAQVSHTIGLRVQGLRATDITPVGVVMNSAGTVAWVALGRANRIARIDVASKTITDLILAGQRSWGLTLSPDEKRLYVTNGLSDDMTIIDAVTSKAIRTVPAGRVPHTVVLSP